MNPFKAFRVALSYQKTCLARIFIQLAYAGMILPSKAALTKGMSHLVFVAYRQSIAVLVLAPFAFLLERLTLSRDLYYMSLRFTTATFASTILSIIPVIAFILLSILLRMESVYWRTIYGQSKIFGVILSVGGTMVLSLYNGPALKFFKWTSYEGRSIQLHHIEEEHRKRLVEGTLLMLFAIIAWDVWLSLQAKMLKAYPHKLRLTTLQCLLSAVQSFITAVVFDRKLSSWRLGWDFSLSPFYIVVFSLLEFHMGFKFGVLSRKGHSMLPCPLALLVTTIFSSLILADELLYTGSVLGGILIVGGLYFVLWGKRKESSKVVEQAELRKDVETSVHLKMLKRRRIIQTFSIQAVNIFYTPHEESSSTVLFLAKSSNSPSTPKSDPLPTY